MKAIFNLRKHSYLKTIGTLLIAVALIAGVVGCEGEGEPEYALTMAENPAGCGTATDETGTSPYAEGTVVDIKAVADDCCRFVDWTAPAGTFNNTAAAETTFTMPARDVTVTANFEPVPPDHFKFYEVDDETAPNVEEVVQLTDQFGTVNNATVGEAVFFGNPVEKVHGDITTPIADLNRHYTLYELELQGEPQGYRVMVNNQFQDDVELTVYGPFYLAVPTQKEDHEAPVCLNHFLVYEANGPVVNDEVVLSDQFIQDQVAVPYEPVLFANPVQKTVGSVVTDIEKPNEHWVLYDIEGPPIEKSGLQITNQFGPQTLDLLNPEYLAVPSQKISWEQPLDHFKTYWAIWGEEPPMYEVPVQLEDQFVTINAIVNEPYLFANPTHKVVFPEEEWTPISHPNYHLTFYDIEHDGDLLVWEVTVDNQFGNGQVLYVDGPFYLAVPTLKFSHGPPVGLDHFLVYRVVDYVGSPLEIPVLIGDQFIEYGETVVYAPMYFAIPAQKIHGDVVTDIKNPDDHLVFYGIDGIYPWHADDLPIVNQFGDQYLDVWEDEGNFLGVPSEKKAWEIAGG